MNSEETAPDRRQLALVFDAPKRGKPPKHWADLSVDDRVQAVQTMGMPKFRAQQLSRHYFEHLNNDPQEWTDLPGALRDELAEQLFPRLLDPVRRLSTDKGMTQKTLWRLHDGALVESVLMRYPKRTTMCVSSQAGCGMACPFCATGKGGLQRNMSAAEIVEQVVDGARALRAGEIPGGAGRVNNIVFMGMGEPLANYKAVVDAVRTIVTPEPNGLGISARGVTVSTVGLVPAIRKLTEEGLPVTLALSLHAPDDELRDTLVPVNNRWNVAEAVDAAYEYSQVTKRRVSIEYALMRDINDQAHRADLLADVLRRKGSGARGYGWVHVNLIPLNEVPGSEFTRSRTEDMAEFVRRLESRGLAATMRDTRGDEIDAACGQLAATES
ncbi:23S rRNA (adenine(2503)-C(2))-methyltransferase RlmN [Naumannella halotolerans]|uniref:23S rRNA (adenine(2503)-C(2))-methyltransferase RlmN n=1 Tax=Naumannella halotolerans TaxID=993414 RepID=UPI00370D965B